MAGVQHILALNGGSGSLRVSLFDRDAREQLADEYVDWTERDANPQIHNHEEALRHLLARLDASQVGAVGHRVVHGGASYAEGVLIDDAVQDEIHRLDALAPLHNDAALEGIRAVERLVPDVPQVAVFDTAFHRTLPPEAAVYPLPYEWTERWGLRRFGFHGLSFAYCAERAATLLGRPGTGLKLIVCHLGSGCSLAAIDGGRSIATTMGFTPLEGLMMATRSGSVDPGLLLYLMTHEGFSAEEMQQTLNRASGLKGVSGISGDMRDIVEARAKEDQRASLAYDLYARRVREGIGAMAATLGRPDVLIFTDGVGEHMAEVRASIALPLAWMGMELDQGKNAVATPDADVAAAGSPVRILVVHTREDLMVARETRRIVARNGVVP
jgi:acetate kinase